MAASDATLADIRKLMNTYTQFAPTNQADITRDFMSRVQNMVPQYNELATQQAKAYAMPASALDAYNQQYGTTTQGGPGAFARLAGMMGQVGQQFGVADALANAINAAQGRVSDYANTAYNQYMAQKAALMEQIGAQNQIYGTQAQREVGMAQAAAAAAAASVARERLNWEKGMADQAFKQDQQNQLNASSGAQSLTPNANWANVTTNNREMGATNDVAKYLADIQAGKYGQPNAAGKFAMPQSGGGLNKLWQNTWGSVGKLAQATPAGMLSSSLFPNQWNQVYPYQSY